MLKDVIKNIVGGKPIEYEKAKELARHADPAVRRKLAAREDLKPEILYFLAEDEHPEVRRQIAENKATPGQADILLATDDDQQVRVNLAEKIAHLAPGLTAHEQDRVKQMAYEALEILARDQVTRVRQVISEALKDVANAPPEVIRRLARDAELVVAGPVLEFSPVLTDDDLLEIIASDPVHGTLSCISRRSVVRESVADAIVGSDDAEAVAELLANPSTQIREETLDIILDRAPDQESWHGPLVRRPRLPAGAAKRLARFVAGNLLETLSDRGDMDPDTVAAVRAEVSRRLGHDGKDEEEDDPKARQNYSLVDDDEEQMGKQGAEPPLAMAKRLHQAGELTEDVMRDAIRTSRRDFVMAGVSVLSGVSFDAVIKAMNNRSAKGVVSLAWKAGLSMKTAVEIQKKVALIPPSSVLSTSGDGGFPMRDDEMEWQIEFISGM